MLLVLTEEVETGKAERLQAAPLASTILSQKIDTEIQSPDSRNNELF